MAQPAVTRRDLLRDSAFQLVLVVAFTLVAVITITIGAVVISRKEIRE